MRTPLTPVICTPSCEDRDGHPLALFREDQICFGTPHPTPLSLENAERSGDQERAAYVETYTQRQDFDIWKSCITLYHFRVEEKLQEAALEAAAVGGPDGDKDQLRFA